VAIEDYVAVADVAGARENATDWYQWFIDGRRTPAESVVFLRDSEAARESILEAAEAIAGRVRPGGTLWFLFIGHGAPTRDGSEGLLLGWDSQQNARSLAARGIRQAELIGAFSEVEHAVLILDACFSGQTRSGDPLVEGLQPLVPTYALSTGSATVLTAARSDQFAGPLPGEARPAFSYLALGALRGWGDADRDGRITAHEVVAYSAMAMTLTVRDRSQTPELSGQEGDRSLANGRETGPDLPSLAMDGSPIADVGSDAQPIQPIHADSATELPATTPSSLGSQIAAMEQQRERAKSDLLAILAHPDPAVRESLLTRYVQQYEESVGGSQALVTRARSNLSRYRRRGPFLGGRGTFGTYNVAPIITVDASMLLAFPLPKRTRAVGRSEHAIGAVISAGAGSSGNDPLSAFFVTFGAMQFFAQRTQNGSRAGLYLEQAVGPEFGDPSVAMLVDLKVMFQHHAHRGFFFGVGVRTQFESASDVATFLIGPVVHVGWAEFAP